MRIATLIATVAAALAVYLSNGEELASYDSLPNSLLALHALETGRLDLDEFRRSYFAALGGQYAFAEGRNGHLTSAYPVGPAIVSFPVYAAFYAVAHIEGATLPALTDPAFEPLRRRYEKIAAALIAALAVGLLLLCAREIGNETQALIATAVFAFATSMWTTGSQALWQHGPVNLFVLGMVYALWRARRAPGAAAATAWILIAGVCAGFLPVIRPTAALFGIAGLISAWWTCGRPGRWFPLAMLAGAAPGIAWNLSFFHSLAGGYGGLATSYHAGPARALTALAGLLVSPSRGLFVFTPVLLFSLAGVACAWRMRDERAQLLLLLGAAAVALTVQYAFFAIWWAGFAYGPRFLTDIVAIASLLLVYALPADPWAFARRSAAAALAAGAFVLAALASLTIQFAGANAGAAGADWNAVPYSVDLRPARVWALADNQIERTLRAAYFRFVPFGPTSSPAYATSQTERVVGVAPALAGLGAAPWVDVAATVANDGPARAYGYATGIFLGQTRVRVRIVDPQHRRLADGALFLAGSPRAGERAVAVGSLALPAAGTYALELEPVVVGSDLALDRGMPYRIRVHVGSRPQDTATGAAATEGARVRRAE